MRKIDEKFALHLLRGETARLKNTECAGRQLFLYGSLIAEVSNKGLIGVTLAGYNTATTRSRINAVLRAFGVPYRVASSDHAPVLYCTSPSAPRGKANERPMAVREWLWFDRAHGGLYTGKSAEA